MPDRDPGFRSFKSEEFTRREFFKAARAVAGVFAIGITLGKTMEVLDQYNRQNAISNSPQPKQ